MANCSDDLFADWYDRDGIRKLARLADDTRFEADPGSILSQKEFAQAIWEEAEDVIEEDILRRRGEAGYRLEKSIHKVLGTLVEAFRLTFPNARRHADWLEEQLGELQRRDRLKLEPDARRRLSDDSPVEIDRD